MLTVTSAALNAIKEHLRQHDIASAVRITLMKCCCVGENLRFVLGEAQEKDLQFRFDGIVFLLDTELSARCGRIRLDFRQEYDQCPCSGRAGGFSFSSERFSFRCGGAECWNSCDADCLQRFAEVCSEA